MKRIYKLMKDYVLGVCTFSMFASILGICGFISLFINNDENAFEFCMVAGGLVLSIFTIVSFIDGVILFIEEDKEQNRSMNELEEEQEG